MAKESIFQRKRREMGSNWAKEIAHDKLYNIAENILGDIAYGNITSNEDKWCLISEPIINILIEFCASRIKNVEYAYVCETFMRGFYENTATPFQEDVPCINIPDTDTKKPPIMPGVTHNVLCPTTEAYFNKFSGWFGEGANAMYANSYENIKNCYTFYSTAYNLLLIFRETQDRTAIINLCSLCARYKKFINPNRFM